MDGPVGMYSQFSFYLNQHFWQKYFVSALKCTCEGLLEQSNRQNSKTYVLRNYSILAIQLLFNRYFW